MKCLFAVLALDYAERKAERIVGQLAVAIRSALAQLGEPARAHVCVRNHVGEVGRPRLEFPGPRPRREYEMTTLRAVRSGRARG